MPWCLGSFYQSSLNELSRPFSSPMLLISSDVFWFLISSDMWFQFNLSCRRNPKNPENHIRSSWNRKSVVRYCTMDASRRKRSRRASSPCACMPRVSSWAAWLSTVDWSHGTFQHINLCSFLRLGDWGYKRSKSNCYANCTLLKIDGVRTKVFLCKHTIIHFQSFPIISIHFRIATKTLLLFTSALYRIRTPRGFVLTLGLVDFPGGHAVLRWKAGRICLQGHFEIFDIPGSKDWHA